MRKYAAYLHSIWFTQRNLSNIFKQPKTLKSFMRTSNPRIWGFSAWVIKT
ncbi:MAG: hypothetical protein ACD_2C00197G0003 [uncultured bacterium (gcode 4)]|uniref:Uncharacterized protein n=1 Tax=uncultured bacterium (gcode 4) TaxID=1234023 RepID=K2G4K5_9BACT|nr:MAG: hypothetical protein ACD_2C00197G0003 [uncultured bacterium (gcode 4)]